MKFFQRPKIGYRSNFEKSSLTNAIYLPLSMPSRLSTIINRSQHFLLNKGPRWKQSPLKIILRLSWGTLPVNDPFAFFTGVGCPL